MLFTVVISNIEGGATLLPSSLACILPIMAFAGLRRESLRLKAAEARTPIAHAEPSQLRPVKDGGMRPRVCESGD
jgi:hypothetical protein